jgi:hypothetical protein
MLRGKLKKCSYRAEWSGLVASVAAGVLLLLLVLSFMEEKTGGVASLKKCRLTEENEVGL